MIDSHISTSMSYQVFPCIGKIKSVLPKDHTGNPTGTFTTYDATVFFQWPGVSHDFEGLPALGQMAGGSIEIEVVYSVGQYVLVGFVEGNQNRPYIMGAWPWHDSAVAHSDGEGPRLKIRANGAEITITKNGDVEIDPASGRTLYLGGDAADASMKRLLHEQFVGTLSGLFSSAPVTPADGGAAMKTYMASNLNAALTTANTTDTTKGT